MAFSNKHETNLIKTLDKAMQDITKCLKAQSGYLDAEVRDTVQSGLRVLEAAKRILYKREIKKFNGE